MTKERNYTHELFATILYNDETGGHNINTHGSEEKALKDIEETKATMKREGVEGFSLYLSVVDYDKYNNVMSSEIFNDSTVKYA